jgi:hypothetical protein
MWAANWLADRGYGTPATAVELAALVPRDDEGDDVLISGDAATLRAYLEATRAAIAAGNGSATSAGAPDGKG